MTGCRIGRVKLKGGADLRILERPDVPEIRRLMINEVASQCEALPNDLAGFVMVTWDDAGIHIAGFDLTEDSPIRASMLPSYIADVLRQTLISSGHWAPQNGAASND